LSLVEDNKKYAEVILPIANKNVDRPFTYKVPDEMQGKIEVGMRVIVPFGMNNKKYEGYLINFLDEVDFDESKIKSIIDSPDEQALLSKEMLDLVKWMHKKYYTSMSECLKCVIPIGVMKSHVQTAKYISIVESDEDLINTILLQNNKQSEVLRFLLDYGKTKLNDVAKSLKITTAPIKTLEKKNAILIEEIEINRNPVNIKKDNSRVPKVLNTEQENAVKEATDMFERKFKKPVLIHGVTGSGKTEVYMEIISRVLKEGKQAIVLVPEISLTPQTLERFVERFGDVVNLTHSKLSNGERYDQWRNARQGSISIMIGSRSAVFAPFKNLGVIIIDEEHESSYKSDTSPKYDTREVAIKRGLLNNALVIMGSATPSIESFYKVEQRLYSLATLKHRVNQNPPIVSVIDMRLELLKGNRSIFSDALKISMHENLKRNEQTILFLNRRGYSTFVSCRKCGHVMMCDQCNVNYTYHAEINKLVCHYCAKEIKSPTECPACESVFIRFFGVGTQKIEHEVKKLFPTARVARMDMDTTSKKNSHGSILSKFRSGEIDILIGTQMIAKGLDFPNVTLVGVVAADIALNAGDYRSGETTFQLLTQVSGRAGRAVKQGVVYIQTYDPEHYSIKFAKDANYKDFYDYELALRRQMNYPPFSYIFVILFTCEDEKKLISSLHDLAHVMKVYNKNEKFKILGPSPAIISKIKNKYRWKIIVKHDEEENLKSFVFYCIEKLEKVRNLKNISMNLAINPTMIV